MTEQQAAPLVCMCPN